MRAETVEYKERAARGRQSKRASDGRDSEQMRGESRG